MGASAERLACDACVGYDTDLAVEYLEGLAYFSHFSEEAAAVPTLYCRGVHDTIATEL